MYDRCEEFVLRVNCYDNQYNEVLGMSGLLLMIQMTCVCACINLPMQAGGSNQTKKMSICNNKC